MALCANKNCNSKVPDNGDCMTCQGCGGKLCFENKCGKYTKSSWASISGAKKSKWRCPECKEKNESESNQSKRQEERRSRRSIENKQITNKEVMPEILELKAIITYVTTKQTDLQYSVDMVSDQYDKILEKQKELQDKIQGLEEQVIFLVASK